MNNNKKNKKGFALTQVLLAVALGAVVAGTIIAHYTHVKTSESVSTDADLIVVGAERSVVVEPQNFDGKLFKKAVANGGVVTATTANCGEFKGTLSQFGTATCTGNALTFRLKTSVVNFEPMADTVTAGTPDAGADPSLKPVDLTGTYVATTQNVPVPVTVATYVPVKGVAVSAPGAMVGNNQSLLFGQNLSPGLWTVPFSVRGNAQLNPPVPPLPAGILNFKIGIYGGYSFVRGAKAALDKCELSSMFNTFVIWDTTQGNHFDYYKVSVSRNGVSVNDITFTSAQLECAASCAHPLGLSQAQSVGMTPDTNWSQLEYDHIVQVGSGITIFPWIEDISASLTACKADGRCVTTSETNSNLQIFSDGQHDCQAEQGGAPAYPQTAHPK